MGGTKQAAKFGGFDGFSLKVVAILGMTCNHVANVFAAQLPQPLMLTLFALGGVTFPVMAFLLVEGFAHTSNLRKYALRLALFACVAQVPYSLLWGAVPNVLFTLLVGLGVLWLHERMGRNPLFLLALMAAAVLTLQFDWGCIGVLLVWLFQIVRQRWLSFPEGKARAQAAARGILAAMLIPYLAVGLPALLELPGALEGGANAAAFAPDADTAAAGLSSPMLAASGHSLAESSAGNSSDTELGQAAADFAADTASTMVPFSLDDLITGDASDNAANTIAQAGFFNEVWGNIGYAFVGFTLAALMLSCYNGKRGRSMKWFFYAYYPTHLLVIWALQAFCF